MNYYMLENVDFRELSIEDISINLLDNFNRYQKVIKCWGNKEGIWTLMDEEYVVDWDKNKKQSVINTFSDIIEKKKGYVFGAYFEENLIGFSVLLNNKFGSMGQYIQLKFLHVSLDYRHKGIRRKLFKLIIKKAEDIGVEKVYISANDSVDTIKFYFSMGCKDAFEINREIAKEEPYDRPWEYKIE